MQQLHLVGEGLGARALPGPVGEQEDGVRRKIFEERDQRGLVEGEHPLHAVEDALLGDLVPQLLGAAARVQLRRDGLDAVRLGQQLPPRQEAGLLETVRRALRLEVEGAHGGDLVAVPFDPQRILGAAREDVQDAAARAHLPVRGDHRLAAVTEIDQALAQAGRRERLADGQVDRALAKARGRQELSRERAEAGHDDSPPSRGERIERREPDAGHLRGRRLAVVGEAFGLREVQHVVFADQELQIVARGFGALRVGQDPHQRRQIAQRRLEEMPGEQRRGAAGERAKAQRPLEARRNAARQIGEGGHARRGSEQMFARRRHAAAFTATV